MTRTVPAQDARNKFAEILNTAVYGLTDVIITRFNKPQAVVMSYKEYERLMNPRSRFTSKEWESGFKVFDKIRAENKNISPGKIEKGVEQALRATRRKKRV